LANELGNLIRCLPDWNWVWVKWGPLALLYLNKPLVLGISCPFTKLAASLILISSSTNARLAAPWVEELEVLIQLAHEELRESAPAAASCCCTNAVRWGGCSA